MVCGLQRRPADGASAGSGIHNPFSEEVGEALDVTLDQEPSEELHFAWGFVVPNKISVQRALTAERAELVEGGSLEFAVRFPTER